MFHVEHPLTGAQLDLLDRYAELLVSYNEKVNLTAITSPEGIEDKHFLDSLLFASQPEVQRQDGGRRHRCGVPGHRDKNLQARAGADPDGAHRQAGGVLKYACASWA